MLAHQSFVRGNNQAMKPYPKVPVLLLCLQLIISISSSSAEAKAAQPRMARRGCNDTCGNVSIPFPWGSGSGCFLDHWFEIECRHVVSPHHSNTTKLPFLVKLGVEVTRLELEGSLDEEDHYSLPRVFIRMPPVNSCTNNTVSNHAAALDLRGGPYVLRADDNVFVMEGCSGSAFLVDESHPSTKNDVGCATVCQSNKTVVQINNCLGVNCCQSPLLNDLNSYQVQFYSQSTGEDKLGHQSCLQATLMEKSYMGEDVGKRWSSGLSGAAPVALRWSWISKTKPDSNLYASCSFDDDFGSLSWTCFCFEDGRTNAYVSGGCPVHRNCQGCPESCDQEDDSPYFSCRSPTAKASTAKIVKDHLHFLTSAPLLTTYAVLGLAVVPLLLVFGCRWIYHFTKRRRKAERRVKFFKLMLQRHQSSNNANGVVESTKLFTNKELDKATEHFNDNRVLGKGGQGTVYKGMLTDGRIVAVKRSMQMDETQIEQFINEVVVLSQTNHRNVVKLLGCCLETEVPLLAYEYISNGTLYQRIHHPSGEVPLSWTMRLQIATDSAGAIAYLHSSSSTPIYHRDIKSANILLDEKYRAKVSDFGSSKTIEIDQTHLTTLVQGTIGYLDPEYFESSVFTEKSDVYSFGVVLLELLTSKKPIFRNEGMEQKSLVTEFFLQIEDHCLSSILDSEVVKEAKEEDILAYADLAKRCLNESGRLRPTMREVAMALEMIIKIPI